MRYRRAIRAACMVLAHAAAMSGGACSAPPDLAPPPWESGPLAPLDWLAGRWVGIDDEGVATEESWTDPAAGSMFGVNRTIDDGRTVFFEFLRIEATADGVLVLHAAPKGRSPATPFTLVDRANGRFVFENPQHDFPQRVIYERRGRDAMTMSVEGDAAPPAFWRMRRMREEP